MKHKTLTFRFLDMSRGGFARLFLLLLLPCLSVIGVKAADSNGGLKNSILVSAIRSGRLIHVFMILKLTQKHLVLPNTILKAVNLANETIKKSTNLTMCQDW